VCSPATTTREGIERDRMLRLHLLPLAAAAALGAFAGPAPAQVFKPLEAVVVNPPSRPVPVTGTVKLDGGVGAITGTLKSGDKTLTAYDQVIEVTTSTFGNHLTGQVDVSDFKEVRLSVSRGSCGPCSQIEVQVYATTANGRPFQIDQYVADQAGTGSFPWSSRTYSVPGSKLSVSLRAVGGGATGNSVLVTIVGRAN
jgi:hypothetical protein